MNSTDVNVPSPNMPKDWTQHPILSQALDLLDRPRAINIALAIIIFVAGWFRFNGLHWDEGHHLHPDERFLSTVTNDLRWPENFDTYFDPTVSTLSPYSLPDIGLYVYGTLPVYVVKWVAVRLGQDDYDRITIVGRFISGLFDIGTILFLFLIGRRLYGAKIALLGAALLSLSVLNIQLSHFYTVDTFANLFVVATIYFLLRAYDTERWTDHAVTGLMFGLGLASKLNVWLLVIPILLAAGLDLYTRSRNSDARAALEHTLVRLLTVFFVAALTFRVIQPIAFDGPGFWNWSLNQRWLDDLNDQRRTLSGEADLPWIQQWTGRSALFPLYNIVVWGMGLPLGLASLAGFAVALFELIRNRKLEHLLPVVYVALTFVYHAGTFVKFMRYFLPIYPFLALFAAYLVVWLWTRANSTETPEVEGSTRRWPRLGLRRGLVLPVLGLILAGTFLYATGFSAIYSDMHPRLQASRWMHANIPEGSTLANEHWDDWLPIGGVDGITAYGDDGMFKSVEMANYEDDTPEKLDRMVENLTQADYIVLSSNRLYDSIPRLPSRYPMTSRYYELLFKGELGFDFVAEFTSYPTLLGLPIPDQNAEESFSVYDHPRVQIFRKNAAFDPERVRQQLSDGIVWKSVLHLTPRQGSVASNMLQLTSDEQALYRKTAEWSSAGVNEGSWGSRQPLLAWFITLELLAILALPLTFTVFRNFADRGYIFSKAIGLLLAGWGAWMISSIRVAPFTLWTILVVLALLAIASAFLMRQRWAEMGTFLKTHSRLILLEEGLFWLFFALMLVVRLRNPDLWHPGLGGEKPMDVAYLTAIVRTPYFPSYDPWFAGGYINYYYFGFVLVGAIIHLTGTVPYIAYNLAVPTFFAMTAMGGFAVAFNFAEGWKNVNPDGSRPGFNWRRMSLIAGLCGALFVAVIGNLDQVRLVWDGVRNQSSIQVQGDPPLLIRLAQFTDGLEQLIGGTKLSFPTEWWYWNATRVIPPGGDEAGPINEMPFFTFLFGDLHAHMMALPYTLLALALAVNIIRGPARETDRPWWRDPVEVLTLAAVALTTGALWPMNTWDFPTYILLVAAALACREFARRSRVDLPGLWAVAWRLAIILVAGRLAFLPFHRSYASSYFGAELWKGSHTPLSAYLLIHGFFLFGLVSYLCLEFFHGYGHNALVRSLRLNLRHIRHLGRIQQRLERFTHPSAGYRLMVSLGQMALALVVIIFMANPALGLALGLTLLTALLLFSTRPQPRRQFLLSMIGLGLLLTALVEAVVLKGDISRMNTVFKFYLQVWVLWAVAFASALPQLAAWLAPRPQPAHSSMPEPEEGSAWTPQVAAQIEANRRRPSAAWAGRWWWTFGLLLAACMLYPLTAAPARMRDRFENSISTTLDGTAYMRTSIYLDDGRPVILNMDRQAFEWLRQNVRGTPTILEANTPLYRWGSRVSIYTGLPTVIGWDWHQKQQRSVIPGPVIDQRIQDVATIYTSTDLEQVVNLLYQYDVEYIYLGSLERLYYAGPGLDKFDQPSDLWSLVYQNDEVKIYQVR